MEIKRLKEEIELNIDSKSMNYGPKYMPTQDKDQGHKNNKYSMSNNASIIKSMEKNTMDAKRYQMSNYIADLQK